MDGWGELQQLQQPSLGATLSGPPSQQQAMGAGPPATPQDYERRVQGWTGALQDMLANPNVSIALLQMGAALSAGRSGPEAMADAAGALGRAGMMQEKMRQQQGLEVRQAKQDQLAERRFGLDERELGMRERVWAAQEAAAGRRGMGGGGAGAGKSSLEQLTNELIQRRIADWQDSHGGPPSPADLAQIRIEARKDAEFAYFGKSKMEPTWNPNTENDPVLKILQSDVESTMPGSPQYDTAVAARNSYMSRMGMPMPGQGGGTTAEMTPEQEMLQRLRNPQGNQPGFGQAGRPGAQQQSAGPNPALAGALTAAMNRGQISPQEVLDNPDLLRAWAAQGLNPAEAIDWAINSGEFGAQDRQRLLEMKARMR